MLHKEVVVSVSHWKKKMNSERNIKSKVLFKLMMNFAKYKYRDHPYLL